MIAPVNTFQFIDIAFASVQAKSEHTVLSAESPEIKWDLDWNEAHDGAKTLRILDRQKLKSKKAEPPTITSDIDIEE